jgi:hypothetical protein
MLLDFTREMGKVFGYLLLLCSFDFGLDFLDGLLKTGRYGRFMGFED